MMFGWFTLLNLIHIIRILWQTHGRAHRQHRITAKKTTWIPINMQLDEVLIRWFCDARFISFSLILWRTHGHTHGQRHTTAKKQSWTPINMNIEDVAIIYSFKLCLSYFSLLYLQFRTLTFMLIPENNFIIHLWFYVVFTESLFCVQCS